MKTRVTRSVWLCALGLLASAMVVFAPVGQPGGGVNIPSGGITRSSATNIVQAMISTTNTWGNAVVPFNRGPNLLTNMAGDLTITGITGFQSDVLNTVYVRLNANGADRVLTVPASWGVNTNTALVNAFTNLTTATIANGSRAWLMVEALIGIETNAYLLPSYY